VNVIEDNVEWTYNLTVPAGETKRLASFTVLGTTRAEAIAAANTLVTNTGFGGEAAAFLTNDELSSLANFQFNSPPAEVVLTGNTVSENLPAGTTVGNLSTSDPNPGDTFTYSLVPGTGDVDNALFTLSGNSVLTAAAFDFESRSSYSLRVRSTDAGGLWTEGVFTITVLNQPEGTAGNDSFVLTYTSTTVSVTVATVGKPISSLGSFPLETPLRLAGFGGTDSVRVVTTAGTDTIEAQGSGFVINGSSLILDSIEATVLAGGAGNDSYRFDADSAIGLITLDDISGLDTLDFSPTTTAAIAVDLALATNQIVNTNLSLNLKSGARFENVIGGALNDSILGNSLANLLIGEAGDDTIMGLLGNDVLDGSAGNDVLDGGVGNDVYRYDADSSQGTETLTDAVGIDTISFASTSASVTFSLGLTTPQSINGGALVLTLESLLFDHVTGGSGHDALFGNALANTLNGGEGDDTLTGDSGNDLLIGAGGNDSLLGGIGNDSYLFAADTPLGSDTLNDDVGLETISFAGTSAGVSLDLGLTTLQTVNGSLAITLASATGFDNIIGGNGDDVFTGNSARNSLTGHAGNDTLNGAAGNDTYVFDADLVSGTDTITEPVAGGIDTLSFTLTTFSAVTVNLGTTSTQVVNANLSLILQSDSSIENITAGTIGSTLIGNGLANRLVGGMGHDRLEGGVGHDTLAGNAGNDTLIGGEHNDSLFGAAGNDLQVGGAGDDTYAFDLDLTIGDDSIDESGGGTDTLDFTTSTTLGATVDLSQPTSQPVAPGSSLTLGSGTTVENVRAGSVSSLITGNSLANRITGGIGDDTLNGGDGDDVLMGAAGNDSLSGGNGKDSLSGDAGNDTLDGGRDDDVYLFDFDAATGIGADVIADAGGVDTLDFTLTTTQGITLLDLDVNTSQVVNSDRLTLTIQSETVVETVLGTAMSDVIRGNGADNVLVGNAGNDTLEGRSGRDILIGGLGADTLDSGDDHDILIGGRTNHDAIIGKLHDLRTEWISPAGYSTRVSNLRAVAGVGATGSSLRARVNVLNDAGADDTLTGGLGADWFFKAIDDTITDLFNDFAGELTDVL
jgi:Ca2+-binding RTX toxin-like protein